MSAPSSLGALVRLFLRLGFAGFGGPLVHIAIMETEVVERRRWLSKQEFLDGLALCQMLPGPASTQLGVLICHARGGLCGALIGGAAFILPGFCVMLGFTLLYERWGPLPALGPVFAGIAPAFAVVLVAVPLMNRFKHLSWMKNFLAGVNASVVGAIVAATILLARSAVVSPFTAVVGLASVGWLWSLAA